VGKFGVMDFGDSWRITYLSADASK